MQGGIILSYLLRVKLGSFWLTAEAEEEEIVKISLFPSKAGLSSYLKTRKSEIMQLSPLLEHLKDDLLNYLQGKRVSFIDYPLKLDDYSPFLIRVWTLTREIPYGGVHSYKWLAQRACTRGYRAVGAALARNPFPILVPCHRVIKKNGSLGGYSGGLELKRELLKIEGIFVS